MDRHQIKEWIDSQQWYQTIELDNGLVTNGKVSVNNRLQYFKDLNVKDCSFLDIGCNSGGYCFWAKKSGAARVVGIDIYDMRIEQAKRLRDVENLEIDFLIKDIFDLDSNDNFDIVFCISVLTEITDIFGALQVIKNITNKFAFIELALAKPLLYWSLSNRWRKGYSGISRRNAVMELHESKKGYMIAPTLELIKSFFGTDFKVSRLGYGERYELIKVERLQGQMVQNENRSR